MEQDYNKLMALTTEMGCRLMESGAEIYRVEESLQRLIQAYGIPGEVFAIPNCIIVSLTVPGEQPVTQIRRVPSHGTDIEQLERYNALSRQLCREKPPLDTAVRQLERAGRQRRSYPLWVQLLGYFLGCGAFALFFGAGPLDGLCGGLCGVAIGVCLTMMAGLKTNLFFKTFAAAFVSALVALVLMALGAVAQIDIVVIGALMALVPGVAITTAIRDIVAGDMVSGISRITEALLIGVAIALGTALAFWLPRLAGG